MKTVKLIDLPIEWKRGNGFRKSDLEIDGENRCVLYGELFTKHKNVLIDSGKLSRTNKVGSVQSKASDILIPGTSTAAKRDMILAREIDDDGVFLGGDINIIRPQKDIFAKKFVAYYFETLDAYKQLERYITGATGIIHISNTGLKNLKIPLPSIVEQKRIVAILDESFAVIDKAKNNAEQNLKNAKELYDSYLQGVFENKGDNWEIKKLGEVLKIQNGYAFDAKLFTIEKGMPLIRIRDIKEGVGTVTNYSGKYDKKYEVKAGDFLIGMDGEFGCYEWRGGTALLNQRVCRLQDFSNKLHSRFLFYGINKYLKAIEDVTTFATVKHISSRQIENIEIPLPALPNQQRIVQKLDALLAETKKLEAIYQTKVNVLEELKKSVLQKAFSGDLKTSKELVIV